MKPPGARPGEFHPRNSPHFRAFAVIAGVAEYGRIPLRCDAAAGLFSAMIRAISRNKNPRLSLNPSRLPMMENGWQGKPA